MQSYNRALPCCYAEVWQAPYRCECNRLETEVTGVAKKNATMVMLFCLQIQS